MPQTIIHKLGSPRKLTGECNTWDVIWALQINGTVHQISMKRRISQKLAVKHNGKTLLDKVFVFSKPYEGYCFVAWASQGVNFGIYYNTPLRCILTNADHYDLRVNGTKFVDLPDGCKMRDTQRRMALGRSASVPAMSSAGKHAHPPGSVDKSNNGNGRVAPSRRNSTGSAAGKSRTSVSGGGATALTRGGSTSHLAT